MYWDTQYNLNSLILIEYPGKDMTIAFLQVRRHWMKELSRNLRMENILKVEDDILLLSSEYSICYVRVMLI